MRAAVALLSLSAIATYAMNASAQEVGSRVRVRDSATETIGTLLRLSADSIVVRADVLNTRGKWVKEDVAIPLTTTTRLDVSAAQHSNAGKGALIGGGIGLGVAALFTLASVADHGENSWVPLPGAMFAGGLVVFVVPGSLIGFAIGSETKWDTWQEVPLDPPIQKDPYEVTEGMMRLGLRISF
jgi:hypothetical protein